MLRIFPEAKTGGGRQSESLSSISGLGVNFFFVEAVFPAEEEAVVPELERGFGRFLRLFGGR